MMGAGLTLSKKLENVQKSDEIFERCICKIFYLTNMKFKSDSENSWSSGETINYSGLNEVPSFSLNYELIIAAS